MTDATQVQAEPAQVRRVMDFVTDGVRAAVNGLIGLPARFAEARAEMRDEQDFEKIHKALSTLNKRQLAMLGMTRDDVYTFAELCVYHPERRPSLNLQEPTGPVLALIAPEAQKALEHFAPITAEITAETAEADTASQATTEETPAKERDAA